MSLFFDRAAFGYGIALVLDVRIIVRGLYEQVVRPRNNAAEQRGCAFELVFVTDKHVLAAFGKRIILAPAAVGLGRIPIGRYKPLFFQSFKARINGGLLNFPLTVAARIDLLDQIIAVTVTFV